MKLICLQDLLLVCKFQLQVQAFRSYWDKTVVSQKETSHWPKKGWVCFILSGLSLGSIFLLISYKLFEALDQRAELRPLPSLQPGAGFPAVIATQSWQGCGLLSKQVGVVIPNVDVFPPNYKDSQEALCLFLSFKEGMMQPFAFHVEGLSRNALNQQPLRRVTEGAGP